MLGLHTGSVRGLAALRTGRVSAASCGTRRSCHRVSAAAAGASSSSTSQQQQQQAPNEQPADRQQRLQRQWFSESLPYYSNYALDRAAEQRRDEGQLQAWFNAPTARVTPVMGSKVLLLLSAAAAPSTPKYSPVWVSPAAELGAALSPSVPPLFLGLDAAGAPHFAVQVTADASQQLAAAHPGASWVAARTAGPDMCRRDAALMAVACGLAQWNLDAQYHGTTGAATQPRNGGFSRRCSSSGRSVYPRIDPAIITLVTWGDWCLLGRKAEWPAGRFSTLAGFLELGETLEQALCREVLEESAVEVDLHSVRYVASQPWPFPRSLMVGFYADAAGAAAGAGAGAVDWLSHQGRMAMMDTGLSPAEVADAVQGLRLQQPKPQEDEMEDVRWFHRDWLQQAIRDGAAAAAPSGFFIPGEYSLAYRLVTGWLGSGGSSSAAAADATSSNGSSNGSGGWIGDQVPQVDIDQGVFKYVLLRLTDSRDSSKSKLLVRGSCAAEYHNHILQHTKAQVERLAPGRLDVQVVGGGRIEHDPEQQALRVYGYSAAFGPAVHEVAAGLLQKAYPFYPQVQWSYEGY